MREKWLTFRSLPRIQQRSLMAAMVLLPLARLSLKWCGLARTQKLLAIVPVPLLTWRCPAPEPADVARMTASAASVLPLEFGCLPRALVTSRLLQRMGLASELRLGIARTTGKHPEAHAWIEHDGQSLDSMPEEARRFDAFQPLPRKPDQIACESSE